MNRFSESVRRARLRPMPSTVAEALFRRWLWKAAVVGNALFAALLTVCIFVDDWPWEHAAAVFTGLAIAFGTLAVGCYMLILARPRHTAQSLMEAAVRRENHNPKSRFFRRNFAVLPGDPGVLIPGSDRISRTLASVALGWTVPFTIFAVVADGGWRVLWLVCVAALVLSVISSAFALRPRWALLTPDRIYVAGSRATSRLRWDDIDKIDFNQGYDGLMVYRLFAKESASTQVTNRHPFTRARNRSIDVEFATLDLDPLLLALAIHVYCANPDARKELEGPVAPPRLTDPVKALEGVQLPKHLWGYRPEFPKRRG